MADDIVYFLMPDGSKVSNDPRFDIEKAREEALASTENRGDIGIPSDEQTAQTQTTHVASINSTQPGVGEYATVDDPKKLIPPQGTPAMQSQREDLARAQEAGADLTSTSVEDEEPVDSNQAVLDARQRRREQLEAAAKAAQKLGEEGPGDPEKPYSEWSATQLKAEALRRNSTRDEGEQLDLSSVRKKSELADLLERDDESSTSTP